MYGSKFRVLPTISMSMMVEKTILSSRYLPGSSSLMPSPLRLTSAPVTGVLSDKYFREIMVIAMNGAYVSTLRSWVMESKMTITSLLTKLLRPYRSSIISETVKLALSILEDEASLLNIILPENFSPSYS